MPGKSSTSPRVRWPDRTTIETALRTWAEDVAVRRPELLRVGFFGSYARGDWGLGSDLDVVVVVRNAPLPFHERSTEWDTLQLPVPVDLLVYTELEWDAVTAQPTVLANALGHDTRWLWFRSRGAISSS